MKRKYLKTQERIFFKIRGKIYKNSIDNIKKKTKKVLKKKKQKKKYKNATNLFSNLRILLFIKNREEIPFLVLSSTTFFIQIVLLAIDSVATCDTVRIKQYQGQRVDCER